MDVGKLGRGAVRSRPGKVPPRLRLHPAKRVGRTASLVLAIAPGNPPRTHGPRRAEIGVCSKSAPDLETWKSTKTRVGRTDGRPFRDELGLTGPDSASAEVMALSFLAHHKVRLTIHHSEVVWMSQGVKCTLLFVLFLILADNATAQGDYQVISVRNPGTITGTVKVVGPYASLAQFPYQ